MTSITSRAAPVALVDGVEREVEVDAMTGKIVEVECETYPLRVD